MTVVERQRGLLVAGVFEDSPAEQKGIRRDLITAVNGKSIAGKSSDVSTALSTGEPGTYVRLTVRRRGAARRLRVRRERIRVPAADAALRRAGGRRVGVLELSTFSSGAHAELIAAIERLERRGADGFVLDLRANGGGLLDEAVLVASAFVPDGVIVSTDGRARPASSRPPARRYAEAGRAARPRDCQCLEIVAAALHEQPDFGGRTEDVRQGGLADLRPLERRRARPRRGQLLHTGRPQSEPARHQARRARPGRPRHAP